MTRKASSEKLRREFLKFWQIHLFFFTKLLSATFFRIHISTVKRHAFPLIVLRK